MKKKRSIARGRATKKLVNKVSNGLSKIIHKHKNPPSLKKHLSFGQRSAAVMTRFCGSWTFIITVSILLGIWIVLNTVALVYHWDPYPFILLNFVLSCLAAMQAPIILMSQNLDAERDRLNFIYDYRVNRKAEREIQNMQKDLDEIKAMIKVLQPKKKKKVVKKKARRKRK